MAVKRLWGVILLLAGTWSSLARAYFIASEPTQLQAGVPTDVFVAGFGNDQGTQFLKSALLAAKVSRDRFPQRQRVIISAVNESFEHEKNLLIDAGFGFRKADQDSLEKHRLVLALKYLKAPVTSLQFYGHANTYNGFRLQSKSDRLDQTDVEFAEIGEVLAPNAFAIFHSCNSGWLLAPAAAKKWRRPVFGSFSSADFQEMMSDGNWYYHDEGMYPQHLARIGNTTRIIQPVTECTSRQCLRLKPVNSSYVDDFGKFEKGLGFYKVFSPTENLIPQSLIHLTLLTPSVTPLSMQSSREDLQEAVIDWMCPSDKSGTKRTACAEAVRSKSFLENRTLNFFSGDPIACSNSKCSTTITCNPYKVVFGVPPCKTVDLEDVPSTVFSDQMTQIMKGLDLFEEGQLDL